MGIKTGKRKTSRIEPSPTIALECLKQVFGMVKKTSLLEKMRANPRGDWKISDIEKLCSQVGLSIEPPTTGSHYKVFSEFLRDIVTIPARRPIKAPYIRNLVSFSDAHLCQVEAVENDDD